MLWHDILFQGNGTAYCAVASHPVHGMVPGYGLLHRILLHLQDNLDSICYVVRVDVLCSGISDIDGPP